MDGLDSSIMPATGTPEPGGLFWDETMKIIKIFNFKSLITFSNAPNSLSLFVSFQQEHSVEYNYAPFKLSKEKFHGSE